MSLISRVRGTTTTTNIDELLDEPKVSRETPQTCGPSQGARPPLNELHARNAVPVEMVDEVEGVLRVVQREGKPGNATGGVSERRSARTHVLSTLGVEETGQHTSTEVKTYLEYPSTLTTNSHQCSRIPQQEEGSQPREGQAHSHTG